MRFWSDSRQYVAAALGFCKKAPGRVTFGGESSACEATLACLSDGVDGPLRQHCGRLGLQVATLNALRYSWGSVGLLARVRMYNSRRLAIKNRERICGKRARIPAMDRTAGMAMRRTNPEHGVRTKQSGEAMERRFNNRGDCCIRAIPARSQTRTIAFISSDGSCVPLAPGENKTRVERNSGT